MNQVLSTTSISQPLCAYQVQFGVNPQKCSSGTKYAELANKATS